MMELAGAICSYTATGSLQSLPDGGELLLCPKLVPCLAITVLVVLLGLDTTTHGVAGSNAGAKSAPASANSSRSRTASSGSGHSCCSGKQVPQTQRSPQQATSRTKPASSSSSSSRRLSNGMSLDSLPPLSHGLFGLLGLDQAVLLPAVEGANKVLDNNILNWHPADCITAYKAVTKYQVSLMLSENMQICN
jgi:hypothetical protein